MSNIAIIPARGGSKRIPRKNIKAFLGKPIIAYSIEAALNSGLFDEVMVSTEDYEIADVAKQYGANVPFMRSQENADDYTGPGDVVYEVIQNYKNMNTEFDIGCCIYPTAPLLRPKRLEEGFNLLVNETFNTVMAVGKFSYPIWRALKKFDSGKIEMFWPEYKTERSQDLPDAFHDAGQFHWFKIETFLKMENKNLFGDVCGAVELNDLEVQDIDNPEDWQMAELKSKLNTSISNK